MDDTMRKKLLWVMADMLMMPLDYHDKKITGFRTQQFGVDGINFSFRLEMVYSKILDNQVCAVLLGPRNFGVFAFVRDSGVYETESQISIMDLANVDLAKLLPVNEDFKTCNLIEDRLSKHFVQTFARPSLGRKWKNVGLNDKDLDNSQGVNNSHNVGEQLKDVPPSSTAA